MNADHFRKRAADARDMAGSGEDPRIAAMLLDLAKEMDAEAALIEAGLSHDGGAAPSCRTENIRAMLHAPPTRAPTWLALAELSIAGACLRGSTSAQVDDEVILEVPTLDLRIPGRVIHIGSAEVVVGFATDPVSRRRAERAVRWLSEPHAIGV